MQDDPLNLAHILEHFVVMTDSQHMPETSLRGAVAFETLIQNEPDPDP
jgi:hypothetical protein